MYKQVTFDSIFLSKKQQELEDSFVCSEEKPELERQLAHAQTFDRGVGINNFLS